MENFLNIRAVNEVEVSSSSIVNALRENANLLILRQFSKTKFIYIYLLVVCLLDRILELALLIVLEKFADVDAALGLHRWKRP